MTFLMMVVLLAAPTGRPMGMTAMKSVVCKPVEEAKGKSGAELAQIIESEAARFAKANYALAALLPGDPPIACFRSLVDNANLPRGAR
jgi:hypothetical protein